MMRSPTGTPDLVGKLDDPGHRGAVHASTPADVERIAGKYLKAVQDAGAIYRKIAAAEGGGTRSSPKCRWTRPTPRRRRRSCCSSWRRSPTRGCRSRRSPRSSPAGSTRASITSATCAQFEKEFRDDLAVIAFAVEQFGLPANLKLSVHSGSDKFSIYADHAPGDPRRSAPGCT